MSTPEAVDDTFLRIGHIHQAILGNHLYKKISDTMVLTSPNVYFIEWLIIIKDLLFVV